MAKYCTNCGSQLDEGVKFCRECGKRVPMPVQPEREETSARHCPACGQQCSPDAVFCRKCGHLFTDGAQSADRHIPVQCKSEETGIRRCPVCGQPCSPDAAFCRKCGHSFTGSRQAEAVREAYGKRQSARRKHSGKKLARSLIALTVAAALVLGLWRPGYVWMLIDEMKDDPPAVSASAGTRVTGDSLKTVETATVEVSPENPAASAAGVAVDFGEYNLLTEETLKVRKMQPVKDESTGCEIQAFDFSLGDVTEFAGLVDVALPYGDCPNPESRLRAAWLDPDTNEWVYLPCEIDTQKRAVIISTDHFSTFAIFDFIDYDGGYDGPQTPIVLNSERLFGAMEQADTSLFYSMLESGQIPLAESAQAMLGTINNTVSVGGHSLTGYSLLTSFTSDAMESLSKKLGYAGIAVAAMKVGMSWYNTGDLTKTVKDNAFDLAEMGVSIAGLAVGGTFCGVAAAGIWLAGFADSTVQDFIKNGYDDYAEQALNRFAEKNVTYVASRGLCGYKLEVLDLKSADMMWHSSEVPLRTMAEWNVVLKCIYKENKNDPKKMYERVERLLDDYSTVFWRTEADVQKKYISDYTMESGGSATLPDSQTQQLYSRRLKAKTLEKLKPLFDGLYKLVLQDAQNQLYKTIAEAYLEMEQTLTFELAVRDENGTPVSWSNSRYGKYVAEFDFEGRADSRITDPWLFSASSGTEGLSEMDKEIENAWGNTVDGMTFKCNLYTYLLAGAPTRLSFYPTRESYAKGEPPEFSLTFKADIPYTVITLDDGLTLSDVAGEWNMTQTVTGYDSSAMNDLIAQMEAAGMGDYAAQYREQMSAANGTYTGTLTITQTGADKADVYFAHDGYDETGVVLYKGTWKGGSMELVPSGDLLGGGWTLNFSKDGGTLKCEGSSEFSSDAVSYSYALAADKRG